jgi:hypothetical protein
VDKKEKTVSAPKKQALISSDDFDAQLGQSTSNSNAANKATKASLAPDHIKQKKRKTQFFEQPDTKYVVVVVEEVILRYPLITMLFVFLRACSNQCVEETNCEAIVQFQTVICGRSSQAKV